MNLNYDVDGNVLVTVADIVAYLQTLKQDMRVELDHDGWMDDVDDPTTTHELISSRGLFTVYNFSEPFLVINN